MYTLYQAGTRLLFFLCACVCARARAHAFACASARTCTCVRGMSKVQVSQSLSAIGQNGTAMRLPRLACPARGPPLGRMPTPTCSWRYDKKQTERQLSTSNSLSSMQACACASPHALLRAFAITRACYGLGRLAERQQAALCRFLPEAVCTFNHVRPKEGACEHCGSMSPRLPGPTALGQTSSLQGRAGRAPCAWPLVQQHTASCARQRQHQEQRRRRLAAPLPALAMETQQLLDQFWEVRKVHCPAPGGCRCKP